MGIEIVLKSSSDICSCFGNDGVRCDIDPEVMLESEVRESVVVQCKGQEVTLHTFHLARLAKWPKL